MMKNSENSKKNIWPIVALVAFVVQLLIAYLLAENDIQSRILDISCTQCEPYSMIGVFLTSIIFIPLAVFISYILSYKTRVSSILFGKLGSNKIFATTILSLIVYILSFAGFMNSIMLAGF